MIEWIKNKHTAEYWYYELETFLEQCWEVIRGMYNEDSFRDFLLDVDKLIRKYKFGGIAEAMLGATMIRRFLWVKFPEIDPSKKKAFRGAKDEKEMPDEWSAEFWELEKKKLESKRTDKAKGESK